MDIKIQKTISLSNVKTITYSTAKNYSVLTIYYHNEDGYIEIVDKFGTEELQRVYNEIKEAYDKKQDSVEVKYTLWHSHRIDYENIHFT